MTRDNGGVLSAAGASEDVGFTSLLLSFCGPESIPQTLRRCIGSGPLLAAGCSAASIRGTHDEHSGRVPSMSSADRPVGDAGGGFVIVVPRDEENRYRLYAVRGEGRELRLLATGPSVSSIGLAIGTMAGEGNIEQADRIGILDTHASEESPGTWVVNPW
jgi:hypothetical protein